MARRASVGIGWVWWPFRILISTATVLLINQAVYAGQFLSGDYESLSMHRDNATVAGITVAAAAVAAVPQRWPGRGPLWPALATAGLFGLIAAQIALGFTRLLSVHVPLGVAIIVGSTALTLWAWRARPLAPVEPTPRPASPRSGVSR